MEVVILWIIISVRSISCQDQSNVTVSQNFDALPSPNSSLSVSGRNGVLSLQIRSAQDETLKEPSSSNPIPTKPNLPLCESLKYIDQNNLKSFVSTPYFHSQQPLTSDLTQQTIEAIHSEPIATQTSLISAYALPQPPSICDQSPPSIFGSSPQNPFVPTGEVQLFLSSAQNVQKEPQESSAYQKVQQIIPHYQILNANDQPLITKKLPATPSLVYPHEYQTVHSKGTTVESPSIETKESTVSNVPVACNSLPCINSNQSSQGEDKQQINRNSSLSSLASISKLQVVLNVPYTEEQKLPPITRQLPQTSSLVYPPQGVPQQSRTLQGPAPIVDYGSAFDKQPLPPIPTPPPRVPFPRSCAQVPNQGSGCQNCVSNTLTIQTSTKVEPSLNTKPTTEPAPRTSGPCGSLLTVAFTLPCLKGESQKQLMHPLLQEDGQRSGHGPSQKIATKSHRPILQVSQKIPIQAPSSSSSEKELLQREPPRKNSKNPQKISIKGGEKPFLKLLPGFGLHVQEMPLIELTSYSQPPPEVVDPLGFLDIPYLKNPAW